MESPFFDRSRYRTDYHCHVLVYSALSSTDVNSVLKQIARRNNDDMLRSRSQSRDYSAIGSPSKHQSEGSQLPNPLQIVVPLTEPVKKVESDRARVNFKFLLKSRQTTRQELVIDAAVESGAIVDFVILLFDLTDRSSFQALDKLISDFKSEYSAHNLAEPTSIIAVGKVQNQEIHQLIYRDEIDLWCSRHPPSASLAVKYLEYTVMYSQGVSDLLAMLIEPFQSRYVTQLSREKSMESPSGRNSIGAGFFQSSYGQHAVDDSAISASGAHNMTASAGMDSMGFDSSRESSGKRKMSAPPALTLSTGNDSDFHMSKSELLERREEQKRAERQRKWQDMESQMRLMLESDQQEEELAERQEQERLQRAASNASSASLPHNNSGGTSNIQLNPSASSSSIMSSAFGLLRNLPPLPPSPSNGAQQQQQQQPSSTHNYSMNTASNAHPPSLSLQPPSNFNASMAAAFGMTQYSSAGSLTPPVPIANTTSSSPSATTSNKRMSKFLFPHNPANNKHHHSAAASGDMMSLKSRSDDAYDHHHHQYRGYGMATLPQRPSIAGHAAAAASSMSAYHYPTTVLPHGSSSTSHHYHHGMHAPPMGGGGAAAAAAANAPPPPGGGYGSHQTRSRPLSTSSLHLPPLPGLLNYPTASSMTAANSNTNNFVHPPSSSSAAVTASTSNTNTNSNTPTNPTPIIASSSSSSISQVVQSVLKRTGSMRSQASQRTSSQVSLRSRHSSHYTVNSSRASSGLDLHVPSADEINLLIETMHSAVKAEQDLFHQTMYLYGASGSDLLLLSSEDGDDDGNGEDDDNDNEDEEEDGGLDGDGLLSMGDDASSTVRPLSSATTSVSGTGGGPSTRPKKTQPQTAAGDSTAPTKAVRTPRGGSQPPVPSHVQAGSPSRRQGRTAAQQPQQPAQAQPPHLSYATSPSSRRHGSLSRAHPSATMAAGNSAYNRSYISDLSMSSRYTQNSLEERGLIDPERGYPAPPAPSDLPVSSPRHHHHHHLHAHLYHPPHAVGPGAGLPPPLGGYATEESVVVASLPAIDGRQRGGSAPTKEEEDHLLDIIVGLIPSPSTNVHKSYRGSPTARSRSNRLSLTQSTNAAGGGGGGSETASVVSVSRQRPSLRSEVDATHDTDADVDSLASPTTIASDHGGGAPSPRPPSGTSLPPGVEEIPSHPSKRPTHRYLIGCGCM